MGEEGKEDGILEARDGRDGKGTQREDFQSGATPLESVCIGKPVESLTKYYIYSKSYYYRQSVG